MEDRRARIAELRQRAEELGIEFAAVRFEHEAGHLTREERIVLSRPIISEMLQVASEMRALVFAHPAKPGSSST